ncbi:MAG: ZIP family metal transporter [Clostridia bacterium]
MLNTIIGVVVPFLGTALGAAMVFFLKEKVSNRLEKALLGFASGVMIAASVWSLLIPAIEMSEKANMISWFPAAVGFILGIFFLLILDRIIPHLHVEDKKAEGPRARLKKSTMLMLAVTLHNIPEGMAVGVIFAGALATNSSISIASAFALSIGMALQNFPEGAIISMPLKNAGLSKKKAFMYGMLSGIVEPIAAIVTIILASLVVPILPYFLSFAAGAMIYVVAEDLIPESSEGIHSDLSAIGLAFGFVIMMILDVALG